MSSMVAKSFMPSWAIAIEWLLLFANYRVFISYSKLRKLQFAVYSYDFGFRNHNDSYLWAGTIRQHETNVNCPTQTGSDRECRLDSPLFPVKNQAVFKLKSTG